MSGQGTPTLSSFRAPICTSDNVPSWEPCPAHHPSSAVGSGSAAGMITMDRATLENKLAAFELTLMDPRSQIPEKFRLEFLFRT
jgi:hypothetical protein